jgi:RNA polymerase sigma-B factor
MRPSGPELFTDPTEPGRPGETTTPDRRFAEYRRSGDRSIRNALVEDHRWLARHCVRRFERSSEPNDDLMQVAMLALVEAVDRFDPAYGYAFSTFAVPTITGELRHHFRDRTWAVRVPRRLKDHHLLAKSGADELHHVLGRSPTIPELAAHCDLTVEETLEAIEAGNAYRPAPLLIDEVDDEPDADRIAVDEPGYATSEAHMVYPGLLALLPGERERRIVELRYVHDKSQSRIATELGLSQVHVSRLLRSSLQLMRQHL